LDLGVPSLRNQIFAPSEGGRGLSKEYGRCSGLNEGRAIEFKGWRKGDRRTLRRGNIVEERTRRGGVHCLAATMVVTTRGTRQANCWWKGMKTAGIILILNGAFMEVVQGFGLAFEKKMLDPRSNQVRINILSRLRSTFSNS
jgi:hypothetical protein